MPAHTDQFVVVAAAGLRDWTAADWTDLAYAVAAAAAGVVVVAGVVAGAVVRLVRVVKAAWLEIKAELVENRAATIDVGAKVKQLESTTAGNIGEQIKIVAEEVRTSTLANALDATPYPTTPQQLDELIRRVVRETQRASTNPPLKN